MTIFPQEPHEQVSGCTISLTQTTQVQTRRTLPVARVLGYYYVPSLAMGQSSLFSLLPLRGQFVDTLVLQVIAWIMRQHMRQKVCGFWSRYYSVFLGGVGQRACTVPTSATQRFRYSVSWLSRLSLNIQSLSSSLCLRAAALSSRPVNGDGNSRADS
jgi:hypothetical protein